MAWPIYQPQESGWISGRYCGVFGCVLTCIGVGEVTQSASLELGWDLLLKKHSKKSNWVL